MTGPMQAAGIGMETLLALMGQVVTFYRPKLSPFNVYYDNNGILDPYPGDSAISGLLTSGNTAVTTGFWGGSSFKLPTPGTWLLTYSICWDGNRNDNRAFNITRAWEKGASVDTEVVHADWRYAVAMPNMGNSQYMAGSAILRTDDPVSQYYEDSGYPPMDAWYSLGLVSTNSGRRIDAADNDNSTWFTLSFLGI